MYKCGLCDKEYQTIEERARCELRCFASMKEKDKLNEQKRLRAEEAADIKEIEDIYNEFDMKFAEKCTAFEKKYNKTIRLNNLACSRLTSFGLF